MQSPYTFIANTRALSAQVNANFTAVVGYLTSHHHDPNIYDNAVPITNSGIAANAQILATQLKFPITLSGLITPGALQNVDVVHGGTGLAGLSVGDIIYADSPTTFKRLAIGATTQYLGVLAGLPAWVDPADTGNTVTLTAGENILQNDMVYPTANDTVKRYRPTGVTSYANATKGVSGGGSTSKNFIISPTRMICVDFLSGQNYRDVVIDPATGDGSSESSTSYATNGATWGDAGKFDSDKILIFWQDLSGGGAASGIKARILSAGSGLGSVTTVETVGSLNAQCSCAILDSTRALITYQRDSDSKLVTRVLTISGTSISLATEVEIPTSGMSSSKRVVSTKVDTDKVLVTFQYTTSSGTNSVYTVVVSISGTTPTVGTSVLLVNNTSTNQNLFDLGIQYLETGKALVVYETYGGGSGQPDNNLSAVVVTVSGTTPSYGSPYTIGAYNQAFAKGIMQMYAFSSTVVAIPHGTSSTSQSTLTLVQISGTTITQISQTAFGTTTFGSSIYGASCIRTGVFKLQTSAYGSVSKQYLSLSQPSTDHIGIATINISSGSSGAVLFRQRKSTNQSGLSGGTSYYINDSGQPTTEISNTAVQYGTAINATSMFLK